MKTDSDGDGCGDEMEYGGFCDEQCKADLDEDGYVNTKDLLGLLAVFDSACP